MSAGRGGSAIGSSRSCSPSRPWASWPTMNPHWTPSSSGPRAPNMPAMPARDWRPWRRSPRGPSPPPRRPANGLPRRVAAKRVGVAPSSSAVAGRAARPGGSRPAARGRAGGSGGPGRPTRPGRGDPRSGWAAARRSRPAPAARRRPATSARRAPVGTAAGETWGRRSGAGRRPRRFEGHPAGDLAGHLPVDRPVRLQKAEHLAEIEPPEGTHRLRGIAHAASLWR